MERKKENLSEKVKVLIDHVEIMDIVRIVKVIENITITDDYNHQMML